MKKLLCGFVVCLGTVILNQPSASAATFNYAFDLAGPSTGASGMLTVDTSIVPGQNTITAITGVSDGYAITGILAPHMYPPTLPPENDNIFYSSGPFLDDNGVSYTLSNGWDANLWYGSFNGSAPGYWLVEGPNDTIIQVSPTAPTPEPGSLALLGTGMVGMFGMARRRFLA